MCVNYEHTLLCLQFVPPKTRLHIIPFWNQKIKANSALDISKTVVGTTCLKQGSTWAMG